MNTDKIYAEQLANEYAPKDTLKVIKLRKLDARAKLTATIFTYTFGIIAALVTGVDRRQYDCNVCFGRCCWNYWTDWNGRELSYLQEDTGK